MNDEIRDILQSIFTNALSVNNIAFDGQVFFEHPAELSFGDWATNIAMQLAGAARCSPLSLANSLVKTLYTAGLPDSVESITVAGPGFINIKLSSSYFANNTLSETKNNTSLSGRRVMVEYTDPNPFKEFHIGHLMNNAVGESFACIAEANGATVVRACYQGDVGPHIAKCIWGMMYMQDTMPSGSDTLDSKTAYVGSAYAYGAKCYSESESVQAEIAIINTAIYNRDNEQVNTLYDTGRRWCLDQFDVIYKKLGTQFDNFYFESQMAGPGLELVRKHTGSVFTQSDGAIVYQGEQDGLHTRVFITKTGTPTYEAKDLINIQQKFIDYPTLDELIIVTANEQNDYFRVMFAALNHINSDAVAKSSQYGHGMMMGSDGKKLSSRKGGVLTGDSLISEVAELVAQKSQESEYRKDMDEKTVNDISVGAIKYSILKQSLGKNTIFDFDTSLSFDGDSGPYLQYTYARLSSLIEKSHTLDIGIATSAPSDWQTLDIERLLQRYNEIVQRAWTDKSPQQIVTYSVRLCQEFNSWYASTKILDESDTLSAYKIAITKKTQSILGGCLRALGISALERM
jgi:arginyl-tRNA synthetase